MTVELKPGSKVRSAVCSTEVVVVRAPSAPVELECGGAPMVPAAAEAPSGAVDPARAEGTLLGKRYADEASGLELLCTKGGDGSLSVGGAILPLKDAKPLPSSD
jgi:hypothetical protein